MDHAAQEAYRFIREGNLEGLKEVLESSPDACSLRPYGQSLALHAVLEDKTELLEFLISLGCDLHNGDDEHGLTPLHAAALNGNLKAVQILLAAGAQVDCLDNYGDTPLFRAVYAYKDDLATIRLAGRKRRKPMG